MLINMRNGLMAGKRLPYDAEVEYLESTGTQYIDTGVALSSSNRVVCDVLLAGVSSGSSAYAFGVYGGGRNFGVNVAIDPNEMYCVWASASILVRRGANANQRLLIDLSSDGLFVDGMKVYSPSGSFTGTAPAYLLWANGTGQGKAIGRIYSASFYDDNGVLVRDFIPVRFTNELGQTEGAMFDRANPTVGMNPDGSARDDGLYRNRGTGAFGYGNDI